MKLPLKAVVKKVKLFIAYRRKRKVILIAFDNDTKIVTAKRSQCGWVANWYRHNGNTVSILLSSGKTAGYSLVNNWLPHSGWDSYDLELLKKNSKG